MTMDSTLGPNPYYRPSIHRQSLLADAYKTPVHTGPPLLQGNPTRSKVVYKRQERNHEFADNINSWQGILNDLQENVNIQNGLINTLADQTASQSVQYIEGPLDCALTNAKVQMCPSGIHGNFMETEGDVSSLDCEIEILRGSLIQQTVYIDRLRAVLSKRPKPELGEESSYIPDQPSDASESTIWGPSKPMEDPFIDEEPEATVRSDHPPSKALSLCYHEDISSIVDPRIYIPLPSHHDDYQARSRRVVLSNLPPDINLPQVLQGVCAYGGIITISLFNKILISENRLQSALIEFVYTESANDYVNTVCSQPLFYMAGDETEYRASAWLVSSPSYHIAGSNSKLLEKDTTRAVTMKNFPVAWLWYLLCAIGTRNLVDVQVVEDEQAHHLIIELASIQRAAWLIKIVENELLEFYSSKRDPTMCSSTKDSSHRSLTNLFLNGQCHIPFKDPTSFAQDFNKAPYNNRWPTTHQFVMTFQGLSPRPAPPATPEPPVKPKVVDRVSTLAARFDIDEDEVDDYLEERLTHQDTEYRILGSTITLTRRRWGWGISAEDDDKLLMANTLHEPDWAEEWDEHFKARGQVNVRRWEKYGMVASHRREKAAELGIEGWMVPLCGGCEMGCRDMKGLPPPDIVRKYASQQQSRDGESDSDGEIL